MRDVESCKKSKDDLDSMLIHEEERNGFFSSSGQAFIRIPTK